MHLSSSWLHLTTQCFLNTDSCSNQHIWAPFRDHSSTVTHQYNVRGNSMTHTNNEMFSKLITKITRQYTNNTKVFIWCNYSLAMVSLLKTVQGWVSHTHSRHTCTHTHAHIHTIHSTQYCWSPWLFYWWIKQTRSQHCPNTVTGYWSKSEWVATDLFTLM